MLEHVKLNDTVYFTINYHNPTGGYSMPSARPPRWLVYRGAEVQPLLSGPLVSRGILGSYVGVFIANAANGFEDGLFYDVQASGFINNESVFNAVKQFVVGDLADVNLIRVNGVPINVTQEVKADIVKCSGVAVTLNDFNKNSSSVVTIATSGITANSIVAGALNGKGDWPVGKTGYTLTPVTGLGNQTATITGNLAGNVTGSIGSVGPNGIVGASIGAGALNGKGDWNVGKTGYTLTPVTGLGNQAANLTGNINGVVSSVAVTPEVLHINAVDSWAPATRTLNLSIGGLLPDQYNNLTVVLYDATNRPSVRRIVDTLTTGIIVDADFNFVPVAGNIIKVFLTPVATGSGGGGDPQEIAEAVYDELTRDHSI